jgi:hypothetical protein
MHLAVAFITLSLISAEAVSQLKVPAKPGNWPVPKDDKRNSCLKPMEDYCHEGSDCPSYDDVIGQSKLPGLSEVELMSSGTCGDLRLVSRDAGLTFETLYFDAQGKLVAVRAMSDRLERPCGAQFGLVLYCKHQGERKPNNMRTEP